MGNEISNGNNSSSSSNSWNAENNRNRGSKESNITFPTLSNPHASGSISKNEDSSKQSSEQQSGPKI
jgi:hypothetical protein